MKSRIINDELFHFSCGDSRTWKQIKKDLGIKSLSTDEYKLPASMVAKIISREKSNKLFLLSCLDQINNDRDLFESIFHLCYKHPEFADEILSKFIEIMKTQYNYKFR